MLAALALLAGEREGVLAVLGLDSEVAQAAAHEEQVCRRSGVDSARDVRFHLLILRPAGDFAFADGQDVGFVGFDDAAVGRFAD